ncbi:TolC family outer membrane protein [Novosphingobium colocasiae]|uniref:TolC family outer membrane protein n=1 Tax=Novosphingobium colocasiae TaxID=1256513 RepID=UPI0035B24A59
MRATDPRRPGADRPPLALLIAACAIALGLPTATARAETLGDAIAAAYDNNPGAQAARASTRAAQERVEQSRAAFGPTLTGEAGYVYSWQRSRYRGVTVQQAGSFTPQASLSVDQPLFTFGRLASQRRFAQAGYGASIAQLHAAEQDLMANVIITYAAVLRDRKLVGIAQENLSLLNEQLDQTSARYSSRYATETDLQQTRNRIFSGQAQLELAQGNLEASRNTFRNLTGHYPDDLAPLPQLPPLPVTIADAQDIGAQSSPLVEQARFELAAARARIGQAKGNARPYVSASGTVGMTRPDLQFEDLHQLSAQARVGVTVPFFSAGLLSARIREAQQDADAASQRAEQTSRDVRENIASFWDQLAAARRALPAYARAVAAAQSALDGAREQQLAGQLTSLDVLDTARDLLVSRQAQAQSEAQLFVQHALLLGAMGQLRADAFAPGTPAYDPGGYGPGPFTGLPSGPLVRLIDAPFVDQRFKATPVAIEHDDEAGHVMAPAPAAAQTGVAAP